MIAYRTFVRNQQRLCDAKLVQRPFEKYHSTMELLKDEESRTIFRNTFPLPSKSLRICKINPLVPIQQFPSIFPFFFFLSCIVCFAV